MELNPFAYEFHENPYPTYKWLRDNAPVYHNDELKFFALSQYADVFRATVDHDTYSSAKGTVLEIDASILELFPIILFMDPPRHSRLRRLVSHAFTPRRIADLEPMIRSLAVKYLDRMLENGSECDFVRDFAALLPIEVISTMVGVAESDRTFVRELSDASLHREPGRPEFPESALAANAQLVQYFNALIADRRAQPHDDMASLLIHAEIENDSGQMESLSDLEITAFCGLLTAAGNETVTKLLGNAVVLLARNADERTKLTQDPSKIPSAVEEILRYWPPAQYNVRTLTRDVSLHGLTMPADSRVLLLLGSACRDEREFADADRFDIARDNPTQLSFGYGIHRCLGASLARLEMRVAMEELHKRLPRYDVDEAGLRRVHMSNVHGFASVPMAWD